MTKYYKTLNAGKSTIQNYEWSLPHGKRPGAWMPPVKGELILCQNGYHGYERKDVIRWLGADIYEMEFREEPESDDDKVVGREARLLCKLDTWNDRTARLFACDCAEQALKLVKAPDPRSIEAVRVARLYAVGKATKEELAAARDATLDAARAAARDATWDATLDAAWSATWAATWDAAWAAAWAATWDTIWDATMQWQNKRLWEYLDGKRK